MDSGLGTETLDGAAGRAVRRVAGALLVMSLVGGHAAAQQGAISSGVAAVNLTVVVPPGLNSVARTPAALERLARLRGREEVLSDASPGRMVVVVKRMPGADSLRTRIRVSWY
jgi:hypothetical protein